MKKQDTHHFFLGLFVLAGAGLIGGAVAYLGADALNLDRVTMEAEIRQWLCALYRDDVDRLELLIGRDLAAWKV